VFVSAYVSEYRDQVPQRGGIEIREKPLSLADLRSAVLDRLGPMTENEAPFHVTDYIQLACMGGRSVILSLRSGGRLVGEIVINGGNVWSARDGHGQGEDAFRRLVLRGGLMVSVQGTGDASLYPRNIEGSGQHVLLEAARLQDEGVLVADQAELDDSDFLDDDAGILIGVPSGDRPPPRRSGRYRIDTPSVDFAGAPRRVATPWPTPSRHAVRRPPAQPLERPFSPAVSYEGATPGRLDAILDRAVELML
jgi:hypothetical protein